MPFASDQQRKWANSPAGVKALGGKAKVDKWNKESKGLKLPKKKTPPKPKKARKSPSGY